MRGAIGQVSAFLLTTYGEVTILQTVEKQAMKITLDLPEKVLSELERKAKAENTSVEGLIADALAAFLDDPEAEEEMHLKLSEKYLREAEEFLSNGDLVQASEKGWGAASQAVKAAAARRGIRLGSHGELHRFVSELAKGEEGIRRLWQSAGMLHQNFYENWLPEDMVAGNIGDVRELVMRLVSPRSPSAELGDEAER